MIYLDDISYTHKDKKRITPVFSHCFHEFQQSKIHMVVGKSGCGKTTLLYILSGLLEVESGNITIDPQGTTSMILQDFGLLPWKTVGQNILLGLKIGRSSKKDHARQVQTIMNELGISHLEEAFPSQLSGGEKQRCAIARALVTSPTLLLMDEPFSALDAFTREGMQEFLLEVKKTRDMTIVMVTHSIEEAIYLGDIIHPMVYRNKASFLTPIPIIRDEPQRGSFRTSSDFFSHCLALRSVMESTT